MHLGKLLIKAIGVSLLLALPALAHHSFAAYDLSRTITVSGTIKELRWGAPHAALLLVYVDAKGKTVDLMVQSGAPAAFAKQGFNPKNFRPGEKVELAYHPNRNGSLGGAMASLKLPDGRMFKDMEVSDPATGANVPPGAAPAPNSP